MQAKLKSEWFSCNHLGEKEADEIDIKFFTSVKGPGLEEYLKHHAFPDEEHGLMRTYLVRNKENELVSYFSLKAGLVSINEEKNKFDTIPGIELANFATNDEYTKNHPAFKGSGLVIFEKFIIPQIEKAKEIIGAKILYIYALPDENLIHRYEEYGFRRLRKELENEVHSRLKPRYDEDCIFMYQLL